MKPDLESLYSQLDLRPNCSLEEFQQACRRQFRELHPDRLDGRRQSAEQRAELRHLISLHSRVNRFHRRYGRMPGANATGNSSIQRRTDMQPASLDTGRDERPVQFTLILMVLLLALLVLGSYWNWLTTRQADSAALPSPVVEARA